MHSQTLERRHRRILEKLSKFYSPLLGMRMQIRAKGEVRVKVHDAARTAWEGLFRGITDPAVKQRIENDRWPKFEALITYSDEQLRAELVPLYLGILELFTTNMQFAEDSTLEHFKVLVEFTELWKRHQQTPMPPEVISTLDHSEKKLYPFYEDLETQFRNLRAQLD